MAQDESGELDRLAREATGTERRGPPPVHLWNPAHCGTIDIRIRADGVWLHEGRPIARPELIRLFASVLRLDSDGYHLVTPVEKLRIAVDDLPFRAVEAELDPQGLRMVTDVGDRLMVGPDHPLEFGTDPDSGEPRPRVHVRRGLWARVSRPVFYRLVEAAEIERGRLVLRLADTTVDLGPVA